MKLATTTGDFYSYTGSQEESLAHIRAAGFRYADYSFNCDYNPRSGVFSDDYIRYFDHILCATEKIGIKLVQAHAQLGYRRPLEDPDGSFLADTLRCVDACGAWNIPNLVVHSGYTPGISADETIKRNKAFFTPLLERAEKYGINILVENFNKMTKADTYWIDNAPDLLKLIELVDHPLFHAVWDVGHANLNPMPQDEALRMLGKHVKALHIQDNMGSSDNHYPPFMGTLNMDSVMCGLQDIDYDGYFTFEVRNKFAPSDKRRTFSRSTLLANPPLALRDAYEKYLYELGKCILEAYDCFEE